MNSRQLPGNSTTLFLVFKAVCLWLLIVVVAIGNGVLRESVLVPWMGADLAKPTSGVVLSVLIFLVSYATVGFLSSARTAALLFVGSLWVCLTLCFEFVFGRFVMGKSWEELLQIFNLATGDLFTVVLMVTACAPWLAAKARRML